MPKREWDNSGNRFGDITKSKEKLGFVSSIELDIGLEKTIDWMKKHKKVIENCIQKHSYYFK